MKRFVPFFCVLLILMLSLCSFSNFSVVFADNLFEIDANSSILIDAESGEVLFEDNADEKVPVASIVKLMTSLITLEEIENGNLKLDEKIVASPYASSMGGSQVFVDAYSEYTVGDMLKSVIVASANDAAVVLAEKIGGSEENFVSKMNERAKALGLKNTLYVNANGLPQPNGYSTARDVALLLGEVIKHKDYFKFSTIWMDELTHPSGRKTEVVNTNKLIRYFKGCDAGKTGSTDEAGYCLAATAQKDGMRLIAVVLGAQTSTARFNETSKLLNFGFTNFENKQIVDKTVEIGQIDITKSKTKQASAYPKEDFFVVCKKGENSSYNVDIELNKNIKAPVESGDACGKIIISKDGVIVKEIEAILIEKIEKITYKDSLKEIISNWWQKSAFCTFFLLTKIN